ncbi:hypothetical protein DUP91_29200 [Salmonella enterica subsp. enterica]|nr:hypothetical protein [Salmonella enterica subsp. enterica]
MWRINTWELPADERVREHNLRAYAPNLPALRKQAQRDLAAAIRARVEPAGYVEQEKDVWVRANPACKTYAQIQKGRDGVSCSINIGREGPLEAKVPSTRTIRLGASAVSRTASTNTIASTSSTTTTWSTTRISCPI